MEHIHTILFLLFCPPHTGGKRGAKGRDSFGDSEWYDIMTLLPSSLPILLAMKKNKRNTSIGLIVKKKLFLEK